MGFLAPRGRSYFYGDPYHTQGKNAHIDVTLRHLANNGLSNLDFPGVLYGSETCIPLILRINLSIVSANGDNYTSLISSLQ